MPLSIFVDAMPYTEIKSRYDNWFPDMRIAELKPNIAYSSSLHWQLYCGKYPDERGVLVDWIKDPEKQFSVRMISSFLQPLDNIGQLGLYSRKFLDRYLYKNNTFANIPYRFRKDFSQKGSYLFEDKKAYGYEPLFKGYTVVSQDEGHLSFETTIDKLRMVISDGNKKIFAVFGFADSIGHKCRRGDTYHERLKPYMNTLHDVINEYIEANTDEEVLIISDHGMSTVKDSIELNLEKAFGKPSRKNYIAYRDSAIMCVWTANDSIKMNIQRFLAEQKVGHLLTDLERTTYGATNPKFGDLIFILREGFVFSDNWFGKSIRQPNDDGIGMHGFWPDDAEDQKACIILINGKETIIGQYNYPLANKLINDVMKGKSE